MWTRHQYSKFRANGPRRDAGDRTRPTIDRRGEASFSPFRNVGNYLRQRRESTPQTVTTDTTVTVNAAPPINGGSGFLVFRRSEKRSFLTLIVRERFLSDYVGITHLHPPSAPSPHLRINRIKRGELSGPSPLTMRGVDQSRLSHNKIFQWIHSVKNRRDQTTPLARIQRSALRDFTPTLKGDSIRRPTLPRHHADGEAPATPQTRVQPHHTDAPPRQPVNHTRAPEDVKAAVAAYSFDTLPVTNA